MRFINKFTEEQRVEIVEESLATGSNSLVAAKYNIHSGLISNWKGNYRRYGKTIKPKEAKLLDEIIPDYKKENKSLKKENDDLKLKVAILEDLLKKNS